MTNNFEIIKPLLNFDDENTFYFIQILKRKKENSEMNKNARVVDNFYIYTIEDLDKLKNKIIDVCVKYNARAYINVNKLNLEKIALYIQKKIIDLIIAKQFKSIKNVYPSVCGKYTSEKTKRWIIDIDTEELKYKNDIINIINILHSLNNKKIYNIVAEIPTKTGLHLISNPFDLKKFNEEMKKLEINIDIHKNSPTILYCL
jgi:hypothetical protein